MAKTEIKLKGYHDEDSMRITKYGGEDTMLFVCNEINSEGSKCKQTRVCLKDNCARFLRDWLIEHYGLPNENKEFDCE